MFFLNLALIFNAIFLNLSQKIYKSYMINLQYMYSMYKQNWPPAQKCAIIEKSTIFAQFWWHFAKMINSWAGHFDHFDKVP